MPGSRWEARAVIIIVGAAALGPLAVVCWMTLNKYGDVDAKALVALATFCIGLLVPSPLSKAAQPPADEPVPVTNAPGEALDVAVDQAEDETELDLPPDGPQD